MFEHRPINPRALGLLSLQTRLKSLQKETLPGITEFIEQALAADSPETLLSVEERAAFLELLDGYYQRETKRILAEIQKRLDEDQELCLHPTFSLQKHIARVIALGRCPCMAERGMCPCAEMYDDIRGMGRCRCALYWTKTQVERQLAGKLVDTSVAEGKMMEKIEFGKGVSGH